MYFLRSWGALITNTRTGLKHSQLKQIPQFEVGRAVDLTEFAFAKAFPARLPQGSNAAAVTKPTEEVPLDHPSDNYCSRRKVPHTAVSAKTLNFFTQPSDASAALAELTRVLDEQPTGHTATHPYKRSKRKRLKQLRRLRAECVRGGLEQHAAVVRARAIIETLADEIKAGYAGGLRAAGSELGSALDMLGRQQFGFEGAGAREMKQTVEDHETAYRKLSPRLASDVAQRELDAFVKAHPQVLIHARSC